MNVSEANSRPARLALHAVATVVATLACAVPLMVFAAPPETATASVALTGLDLTTPDGARAAHSRLAAAAARLCRRLEDTRRISHAETARDCYRDTLAEADRRLETRIEIVATNVPRTDSKDR